MPNVWAIGTSGEDNLNYWEQMLSGNYMAIGWDTLGDLNEMVATHENIKEHLGREDYNYDQGVRTRFAKAILTFKDEIANGDIVITQKGDETLGIGIVNGVYYYGSGDFKHRKPVLWLEVKKNDLQDLPISRNRQIIVSVNDDNCIATIMNIVDEHTGKKKLKLMLELLKFKYQIILQGPPGTGKTFQAKNISRQLLTDLKVDDNQDVLDIDGNDRFAIVQLHPSYTYEDFVRGVVARANDGIITYHAEHKILSKMAKAAADHPDLPYVLIIDEINRANLPAVLGELLYALEYRGKAVKTPYKVDGSFDLILPKNLYIIGTMNNTDRSIGQLDYAIRRRFAFETLLSSENHVDESAKEFYYKVKEFISDNLSSEVRDIYDIMIGHSYFIKPDGAPGDWLELRKKYEIYPLIEEYLRDGWLNDSPKARDQLKTL